MHFGAWVAHRMNHPATRKQGGSIDLHSHAAALAQSWPATGIVSLVSTFARWRPPSLIHSSSAR